MQISKLLLAASVALAMKSPKDMEVETLSRLLKSYTLWGDCEDLKCACKEELYPASVAITVRENVPEDWKEEIYDKFIKSKCKKAKVMPYEQALKITETEKPIDSTKAKPKKPIEHPVLFASKEYQHMQYSSWVSMQNKDTGVWTGSFLTGYWLFLAIGCMFLNLFRHFTWKRSANRSVLKRPNALFRAYQKHIEMPALYGFRHMQRINFYGIEISIPTRWETLVIFFYFACSVILLCTQYRVVHPESARFGSQRQQLLKYVADRAGIQVTVQLPLLVLFALRNNFLMWMTGWSFSTYQCFHRAVARVCYLQIIIHAACYHMFDGAKKGGIRPNLWVKVYFKGGVVAGTAMAALILSGLFRHKWYEAFLVFHIGAAVVALYFTYDHLATLEYMEPVYVAFGLWAADWLIRGLRVLWINIRWFRKSNVFMTESQMSLIDGDVVKMDIDTPCRWTVKPGQYVFIHIFRMGLLESHPFSVMTSESGSFQLMARARGGMTRRLAKSIAKGNTSMKMLIDGVYGHTQPVDLYDNVLLVAGGIGITAVIPYAEDLVARNIPAKVKLMWTVRDIAHLELMADRLEALVADGHVQLELYVSQSHGDTTYLSSPVEEKGSLSENEKYSEKIEEMESDSGNSQEDLGNAEADKNVMRAKKDHHLHMHPHNPDLPEQVLEKGIQHPAPQVPVPGSQGKQPLYASLVNMGKRPVLTEVVTATFTEAEGSVAVLGCGPATMVDALRGIVSAEMGLVINGRVDYYEEAFGW
ncbi:Ferric reductase transmembrane component 3 [Yarrowia sp. B02]|nr:Ferric reductase transmembrane component 3 [Yarrowia sp. B02]